MEEKKLSDQKGQTASEESEAVKNLPPAVVEDELKKLTHFTGTLEIPLPAPISAPQDQKARKTMIFPHLKQTGCPPRILRILKVCCGAETCPTRR